jgi:hypothetical protein
MRFHAVVAGAGALALGLFACGGSAEDQAAPAAQTQAAAPAQSAPAQPKLKLTVVAPSASSTVRASHVAVRGTVVPADARVQVLGQPARVTGGLFSADATPPNGRQQLRRDRHRAGRRAGDHTATRDAAATAA